MAPDTNIAAERTVVRNPNVDDENAGVIIAAGDELPEGAPVVGYQENTPNKVDAANNWEVADAADQAQTPTPAGPLKVKPLFGGSDRAAEDAAAAAERIAGNRDDFEEEQRKLSESTPEPVAGTDGDQADAVPTSLGDMTKAQLDDLAASSDVADYPAKGNKAEKVAALEKAGVTIPSGD
jgi:hypothetical protein